MKGVLWMRTFKKFLSAALSAAVVSMTAIPMPFAASAATQASGSYNYGEALQKAIMFYEFQRSGPVAPDQRNNWRGDSGMSDGSDVGLDLTGGYYDAGDHVKFNLPMSYTAAMLAWDVYENKDALASSGQLSYIKTAIKWATDYLIKCHPSPNVFYYQVGDGSLDHAWWGPAEVMQMKRPAFKVDTSSPGSTVSAEAAAALAAAAVVFEDSDPSYAANCLSHAKDLFNFADSTKSDAGYTAASGYYNSFSGFYDELSWAAVWLYIATGDSDYLDKAESYVDKWNRQGQSDIIEYKYTQCWDDVHYGAQLLLARITGKSIYKESVERNLDWWTTGYDGDRVTYTPKGLAWLQQWGPLRYATTAAFLADVYANSGLCSAEKANTYKAFAKQQVDYALGSSGRSYVIGFGTNYPKNPHHRTAESSWADSMQIPGYCRHLLVGALVGGPDQGDSYDDSCANYTQTEVACDYNAGLVCALTSLYRDYGGSPIEGLNAIETPTNNEFFVEASVNSAGSNFEEIKALIYNESGWPARMGDKLSFKYFIDISELVKAGYSAKDVTIKTNYNAGATVSGLYPWDEAHNIYYVNVDFTGTKIYPGGQSVYRKEVQFRMSYPENVNVWDNSNDFSYEGISTTPGSSPVLALNIPVYDDGVKIFGNEPGSSGVKDASITPTTATFDLNPQNQADISVAVNANGNTLKGIYYGTTALVKGTDYTVSSDGKTVTISKSFLSTLDQGTANLKFDFDAGADPVLTVTITDTTPVVSAEISPTTATFDLNPEKQADIPVSVTYNGKTLKGIYNGTTALAEGTDYTVSSDGDTITILKSYLATLDEGTANLRFDFDSGTDPVLKVTITDSTPVVDSEISPTTATFDLNAENQADIPVEVTYNGNTLNGIYNGSTALVKGTDYTVSSDGTVTILKSYLSKQPVGTLNLIFDFNKGTDPILAITVVNTSPIVIGDLKLQMFNSNTQSTTNGIMPRFRLVNTGDTAVDLSTVKIRYYFTEDGTQSQNFWCDWSSVGSSNVTSTFVKMDNPVDGADTYLEIGFTSGAGQIAPGASVEVQARFSKADWSDYNQADDYSFNPTDNSYVDWTKATLYIDGKLEWGMEP